MNGYVVNFQLKGMQMAIQQMNAFTKALQGANGANVGMVRAGGGGGSSSQSAQMNAASKSVNAQANFLRAQAAWLRAQVSAHRAATRQARQAPGVMGAMKQLLYSTRVGVGGGGGMSVMPLIGNVLKVLSTLGPEAEIAALAIGSLVAAMVALTESATQFGVNYGQAQFASGGTSAEASKLIGAGAIAGIGAAQMGQMAQAYNQSLMNNPYANARAQAGGYGPNYAGSFGDTDDARRLLMGLKDMLNTKSDQEAIRMARGTPIEQFLWMRNADKSVRDEAMASATLQTSPQALKDAANTQIEMNEATAQASLLMTQLGQMVLPGVIMGLSVLNAALSYISTDLWGLNKLLGGGGNPMDDINKAKAGAQAKAIDAQNRNSNELANNTKALNSSTQMAGGGPNSDKSLPGKWIGPGSTRSQINYGQIPI